MLSSDGNQRPSEVAGEQSLQVEWPTLRYANCWEDADVLCRALRPGPGKRILSIPSGGDNSFALAAEGAEVVAVDHNPSQLACAELKQVAIRRLPYDEVLGFFGFRAQDDRPATFQRLLPDLSRRASGYWSGRPQAIDQGFAHSGKFEAYFSTFRRRVLPLIHRRSVIEAAMVERSPEERERFYREVWDNTRWRMLFKIFFSQKVMGAIGRDRATFRYVDGAVADKLIERARRAFINLPPQANPFIEYISTGTYDRCLPRYLEPDRFEAVREGLDRVSLVEGQVEVAAENHAGDGFDGFNLSDIFEYLSEDAGEGLHQRLLTTARSGARLAYWNMLVPRRFAAKGEGRAVELSDLAEQLHACDRAFFYGAFIVEELVG